MESKELMINHRIIWNVISRVAQMRTAMHLVYIYDDEDLIYGLN
jgi:hypothetical protein